MATMKDFIVRKLRPHGLPVFVGRRWLFQQLREGLQQPNKTVILITGDMGRQISRCCSSDRISLSIRPSVVHR